MPLLLSPPCQPPHPPLADFMHERPGQTSSCLKWLPLRIDLRHQPHHGRKHPPLRRSPPLSGLTRCLPHHQCNRHPRAPYFRERSNSRRPTACHHSSPPSHNLPQEADCRPLFRHSTRKLTLQSLGGQQKPSTLRRSPSSRHPSRRRSIPVPLTCALDQPTTKSTQCRLRQRVDVHVGAPPK
jgi:hypothetical protein